MTVRPTPMVCRLLLVCVFCTLWGGQVIAVTPTTPKEKVQSVAEFVKNAQEATQKILADLTTAEECANKQKEIEKENVEGTNLTPYYEKTKRNGEELSVAVTNATERAKEVLTAVKAVEPSTKGEHKQLMTDAVEKSNNLFTAVSEANAKAQEIYERVQTSDIVLEEGLAAELMKTALLLLEKAKDTANLAEHFFQEAVKKTAGTERASKETSKNVNNPPAETSQRTADNGSGKGETKDTDRLQDSVRPQNSDMNSPPATKDNEPSTPERNTPPPALQDGNDADTAHGGAIATCTAAPLLLLLTAVAYAAVC